MASISLKKIRGLYPGNTGEDLNAVSDLELEIGDRELVVLLGPPSGGITSLVRMIAGLDETPQGEMSVGDRRVNDLPPKDRDIAMVPQGYVPYPQMSVHENLKFPLTLRQVPRAEIKKRVHAAAGLLGLQEILESNPGSLSDEQRQRVAIARAVALQPKAFLFDRALSKLDAGARAQLRNEIVKLHQRLQVTMIFATDDPIEAMAMGGRIIVINEGAIQQDGTGRSLYDQPANVFVAEFMDPPMNLIQGTLKQDRDWVVFKESEEGIIEVRLPIPKMPGVRDHLGGMVVLGIRPDDVEIVEVTEKTEQGSSRFPALIDAVESIGKGSKLSLLTGAHALVCRSQRQVEQREAGHRSQFKLNAEKICLFDPVSRRRIA